MKAAVLVQPGKPLEIETLQIAKPGPHEVLIRNAACGLCHSDLHFIDGAYPHPLPAVPGHEAAGIVEAVGSEVTYGEGRRCRDHLPVRVLWPLRILRHRAHVAVPWRRYAARPG